MNNKVAHKLEKVIFDGIKCESTHCSLEELASIFLVLFFFPKQRTLDDKNKKFRIKIILKVKLRLVSFECNNQLQYLNNPLRKLANYKITTANRSMKDFMYHFK